MLICQIEIIALKSDTKWAMNGLFFEYFSFGYYDFSIKIDWVTECSIDGRIFLSWNIFEVLGTDVWLDFAGI